MPIFSDTAILRKYRNHVISYRKMASTTHATWGLSNSLIISLIIVLYILLPLPFFLIGRPDSKTILSFYQYTLPFLSGGLILLFLFKQNRIVAPTKKEMERIGSKRRQIIRLGALAGCIASFAMLVPIFLGEYSANLPEGTYLSILGAVMGNYIGNTQYSFVLGLMAHLITGTAIGAVFGCIMSMSEIFDLRRRGQTVAFGIGAGFITFLALFNPISRLGIEPYLQQSLQVTMVGMNQIAIENAARSIMSDLLAGSLLVHLIYGFILGIIFYTLARKYS
ncbi:MAG: hypothetical protein KGH99_02845 [Thaumarchaeota archaeon]|nr:hypothetical protein [Nitrososphaerota archaeon]MDE1872398.1 hypothetical protein [Nitrososphaerota archaeon]